MIPSKKISLLLMIGSMAFVMAACSGVKGTSSGTGTGGATGSFTVGGTITNLVGSGLVVTDNSADTLTITKTGTVPFTFAKSVSGAYDVEIQAQPTNPAQTCTLTGNKGTATANVTTVAIACTTNPVTATIGGTLSGLSTGDSVILQDNGGDALTLTANGPFTFKTPVTGPTDAYAVTVNTQPTNPLQICTVTNGSGTATANVTNVAVNCVLAYTIGGNITGLVGSGLVLLDTVTVTGSTTPIITEQLPITATSGNAAFTFKQDVPTGATYTVSIYSQPSNPGQTCVVTPSTATGAATANVTSVVVTCPAVTYSVGGTVVGLAGVPKSNGPLTDSSFVLQNVLGNTRIVPQNGPFTFATPEALNDQYEVSVFHPASSQPQGCTLWDYKGVVTANVKSIVVDCGHNDWTWIDGTKTAGYDNGPIGPVPQYGSFPQGAPPTIPNPFTNTPGARFGAAGWTDLSGNLWLFGGQGYELSGNPAPSNQSAPMNDLWVCVMLGGDYCEWMLVGAYSAVGAAIYANAQNEGQTGTETSVLMPYSRLGAAAWTDKSGNLWLFGGSAIPGFLNDMWEFNTSTFTGYNTNTFTNNTLQWSVAVAGGFDKPTTGTTPGARVNATTWTDSSGNFWLFGGYGYDGTTPTATLGFLNDLWMFNPSTKTWTYVPGTGSVTANQKGVYGTQGVSAGTNMPGSRQEAVGWADASGNLWLFGGEGLDSAGTKNGVLNDLWVYNIASKQWTWVTGSNMANQTGDYEAQPVVGPVNTTGAAGTCGLTTGSVVLSCSPVSTTGAGPGSRWGGAAWIDKGGTLWLFGGWGLDATATNGNGALNDLWAYTPNATVTQPGTWVWVKGANTGAENGSYDDMLRSYKTHYTDTPGGRSNATYFIQTVPASAPYQPFQQFWLFGGEGYDSTSTTGNGYLNDMWRYVPYQDY
jgi:hypothetical protein